MRASKTTFTAAALILGLSATALTACGTTSDATAAEDPLTVLASVTPHSELLEWADENNDEFDLDVSIVTGGPEANAAVANGSADVNFFQHVPYLNDWMTQTDHVGAVVNIAGIHLEPMSLYSLKLNSIDELKSGDTVSLPRSASNYARGLLLLEDHGLLSLREDIDPANISSITEADITDNPLALEFIGVDDEISALSLEDDNVAASVLSSNVALQAGYDSPENILISESSEDNPYTNILVSTPELAEDPRVIALVETLTSPEAKEWIEQSYGTSVVPATTAG